MANGEWIKMRVDLYRNPKVIAMADLLTNPGGDLVRSVEHMMQCDMCVTRNVMRNAVVGALVTVWGVVRRHGHRDGDDARLESSALGVIDDVADMPGFGAAMAQVGWVVDSAQGLVFAGFYAQHNVDPKEKSDQKNRERQRRYRERHSNAKSNVTGNVTVTHRGEGDGEKRREEIPSSPDFNSSFSDSDSRQSERVVASLSFIQAVESIFSPDTKQRKADQTTARQWFDELWPEGAPANGADDRVMEFLGLIDKARRNARGSKMAYVTKLARDQHLLGD